MSEGRGVVLAGAGELKPLRQGDLDGLCGLYSLVNAITLATFQRVELRPKQKRLLFGAGSAWLQQQGVLADAALTGMEQRLWREAARVMFADLERWCGLRLTLKPVSGLGRRAQVFSRLAEELEGGRPVLVEIRRSYRHYSVICGITADALLLFDSYGYKRLRRSSCRLDPRGRVRRHELEPSSLLAVRLHEPR